MSCSGGCISVFTPNSSLCKITHLWPRRGPAMQQRKCDWMGCSEIGFFDGLDKTLLTEEGKRHIFEFLKLIFLCQYHFKLGVRTLDVDLTQDSMAAAKR